jgi:hypothetical protein
VDYRRLCFQTVKREPTIREPESLAIIVPFYWEILLQGATFSIIYL